MNTYVVREGETPMSITRALTGSPARVNELIRQNPAKPAVYVGQVMTFRDLTAGEVLRIPPSWLTHRGVGAAPHGNGGAQRSSYGTWRLIATSEVPAAVIATTHNVNLQTFPSPIPTSTGYAWTVITAADGRTFGVLIWNRQDTQHKPPNIFYLYQGVWRGPTVYANRSPSRSLGATPPCMNGLLDAIASEQAAQGLGNAPHSYGPQKYAMVVVPGQHVFMTVTGPYSYRGDDVTQVLWSFGWSTQRIQAMPVAGMYTMWRVSAIRTGTATMMPAKIGLLTVLRWDRGAPVTPVGLAGACCGSCASGGACTGCKTGVGQTSAGHGGHGHGDGGAGVAQHGRTPPQATAATNAQQGLPSVPRQGGDAPASHGGHGGHAGGGASAGHSSGGAPAPVGGSSTQTGGMQPPSGGHSGIHHLKGLGQTSAARMHQRAGVGQAATSSSSLLAPIGAAVAGAAVGFGIAYALHTRSHA